MQLTSPEEVGFCPRRLDKITPMLQKRIDQKIISGCTTLIARQGKIVYCEALGLMDKEANKPMTKEAIFRMYSMTKPIIATALMILYERGLFQLFDPVAKFIPAFAHHKVLMQRAGEADYLVDAVRPMTIADLLIHTSGLTYNFLEDSPVSQLYRESSLLTDASRSLAEFVNELARMPLAFQPGSRWHYSVGIDVAAHLIEILADQPLRDFLQEQLFQPLAMHDTDFGVPPEKLSRLVTMYGSPDLINKEVTVSKSIAAWEQGVNERIDVAATYPVDKATSFARGGHGLFSTASDYFHFAQMLLNHGEFNNTQILSRKTLELMHSDHLPAHLKPMMFGPFPILGYGHGLGSRVLVNVPLSMLPGSVGEFGWAGAANTYYWIDPVEKIVGIYLTQKMMGFDLLEKYVQVLTYQALK